MSRTNHDLEVVGLDRLTPQTIEAWHSLRLRNPGLASPYFDPAFARAVHGSGNDVDVVVRKRPSGAPAVILPLHRRGLVARPVGWPAADFQGPIYEDAKAVQPLELIRGAGLRAFQFDHLLDPSDSFRASISTRQASPFLDVTGGLEGYLGRASSSGKDGVKRARGAARRVEQAFGAVRFDVDSRDATVLDQVVELKRMQYRATGARDYFADPRRRALVHALLRTREPGCRGVLSTIHAGPHLVSAHFGIASQDVLHWWFPVYDRNFAQFRPGWMMLRELISAAPSMGISRIDLGRGEDEYKRRCMTGETTVCAGIVGAPAYVAAYKVGVQTMAAIRSSPAGPRLRALKRRLITGAAPTEATDAPAGPPAAHVQD